MSVFTSLIGEPLLILRDRMMSPSVSFDLVFEDVAFVVVGGKGYFVN